MHRGLSGLLFKPDIELALQYPIVVHLQVYNGRKAAQPFGASYRTLGNMAVAFELQCAGVFWIAFFGYHIMNVGWDPAVWIGGRFDGTELIFAL